MMNTMITNEQCWILLGGVQDRLWWGRVSKYSIGKPASVKFDSDFVMKREEEHGDIVGFIHTHPGMPAIPSSTDHATMHAWVCCFGKPLLCVIRGVDGLRAWCYYDDELPPFECVVKKLGRHIFGCVDAWKPPESQVEEDLDRSFFEFDDEEDEIEGNSDRSFFESEEELPLDGGDDNPGLVDDPTPAGFPAYEQRLKELE
jgi:proteasome lid subunit RPN8/RPN11